MASKKNNTQEENAIESLNARLTGAGEHIANNKKVIYWTLGIILVVAASIFAYFYIYMGPRTTAAWEAYNAVELQSQGNDSIAAKEYKKVADKYSSTDAGNVAYLTAAESLYNIKDYAAAVDCLKKFSTKDEVLGANALILEGDCYVNLKKYDQAIDCFKKAVRKSNNNPQIAPRALLKQATVYTEQKKYGEALACYETIQKDFPQFQLGSGVSIDTYIEREKARSGK